MISPVHDTPVFDDPLDFLQVVDIGQRVFVDNDQVRKLSRLDGSHLIQDSEAFGHCARCRDDHFHRGKTS